MKPGPVTSNLWRKHYAEFYKAHTRCLKKLMNSNFVVLYWLQVLWSDIQRCSKSHPKRHGVDISWLQHCKWRWPSVWHGWGLQKLHYWREVVMNLGKGFVSVLCTVILQLYTMLYCRSGNFCLHKFSSIIVFFWILFFLLEHVNKNVLIYLSYVEISVTFNFCATTKKNF